MDKKVYHKDLGGYFEGIKDESQEQRVRRFFAGQEINQKTFAKAIIDVFYGNVLKMHIIIDRTNWKFGNTDINYLVLAARIGNQTFPLFWTMLDHRGNSNTAQRMDLLDQFIEVFGTETIQSLTGDREFIGDEWIQYLGKNKVPFFIRVRSNMLVTDNNGEHKHIKEFFNETKRSSITREMYGQNLMFVGKKMPKTEARTEESKNEGEKEGHDEYLIICSNVHNPNHVFDTYKTRWNIEMLFKYLKSAGFNLEDTHMRDPERLEKLMSLLSVATIMCFKTSIFKKTKRKETVNCNELSLFARGLRWLRRKMKEQKIPINESINELFNLIPAPG